MRGKGLYAGGWCHESGITPAYAGKSALDKLQGWREVGSPPRMRGKVDDIETGDLIHGITPAYAGKSPLPFTAAVAGRDHPRVCGEKVKIIALLRVFTGSPPRMRGKAAALLTYKQQYGITPAYAGKSPDHRHTYRAKEDHPRVCGEKQVRGLRQQDSSGSPPRMRGKAAVSPLCVLGEADHPRVCGEKSAESVYLFDRAGSPPRMRGKGKARPRQEKPGGITPAYAGKSSVHATTSPGKLGSPPRMRGKVDAATLTLRARGITPAYAGKSDYSSRRNLSFKDHPRVCGEKTKKIP